MTRMWSRSKKVELPLTVLIRPSTGCVSGYWQNRPFQNCRLPSGARVIIQSAPLCYISFFFLFISFCWERHLLEFGACVWHSFWSRFKGIDFVNCVNVIVNIFSHLEEENSSSCLKRPAINHGLFTNLIYYLLFFKYQANRKQVILFRMQPNHKANWKC